ncbi:MAG TPA: GNAT family N-acetyltransferase [Actinophytocola sp.]|uniref:GNAT family N-acetyltransferase n=1 Tax=Actinophytocola sp. TaxID=1872138 RepID=UPI002DDDA867|nr:GNAT family N-acetyltransferase [Actinophytocola sp.]HEV2783822.1 GNAT family N-acetyltransferase [Actinophytocola sp.]
MSVAPQSDQLLTIRTLTDADLPAFSAVLASAFLIDHNDDFLASERTVFEPARSHGVFDGAEMIGSGQLLTRRLVVPGAGPIPAAAVTSIGVAPGHRRRGVLSMIMRTQLAGLHETGEPIAALWASEGGIYGRFGYGLATQYVRLALPRGAAFRRDVEVDPAPVRELPREQALPLIRKIYESVWADRVGYLDRTDGAWDYHLFDAEPSRRGQTAYRFAVHPEGYAVYRTRQEWQDRGPRSPVTVRTLVAANPPAYAAICRYVLDIDLVGEVTMRLAVDEPLVHMLADSRAAVRTMFDALWVRLVDVDRALAARRYAVPVDVVLEVADELCPWNAGRWRLAVGEDGRAEVERSAADPDLALGVEALGAAYLGGTRLATLAAAGRVRELRRGALARTSLAFLHDREPGCLEDF